MAPDPSFDRPDGSLVLDTHIHRHLDTSRLGGREENQQKWGLSCTRTAGCQTDIHTPYDTTQRENRVEQRTSKTSRLLEGDADLSRVPAAVVAVEEERWVASRVQDRRKSAVAIVWRVRRHDAERVPATWAHEAVSRAALLS